MSFTGFGSPPRLRWPIAKAAYVACLVIFTGVAAGSGFGGTARHDQTALCKTPDKIKVHLQNTGNVLDIVAVVGENARIFKANCLQPRNVSIVSGPAGLAAAVGGSVDFVSSAPDNILNAIGRGLPVKIVANELTRPFLSLVVAKDIPLPNRASGYPAVMRDLANKKIGAINQAGNNYFILRALFSGAGIDPNSVNFVTAGPTPTALAALANGSVDAAIFNGNGQDLAQAKDLGLIVVDLRRAGVGPPSIRQLHGNTLVWATPTSFISKKKDVVRRFIKANRETIAWIKLTKNRPALYRYMSNYGIVSADTPNRDAVLHRVVDLFASMVASNLNRNSIEAWNKFAIQFEGGTSVPYEEAVYTP